MKKLVEKLTTKHFSEFPYHWMGSEDYGFCAQYYHHGHPFGLPPKKGDYVFSSGEDQTEAFEVTYVNKETQRLRVRQSDLKMEYNEIYKKYLKENPDQEGFATIGSRILLVEK